MAPEAEPATLDPDVAFRDQLDLDSMDFSSFMMALHGATGTDVPVADDARLTALRDRGSHLGEKLALKGRTP